MIHPAAVSIIIPVFNIENYVGACLESIKKQSIQSFEAIIINDGSSDNSLRIIESATLNDKRFKVINQINSGVSKARNTGIKQVSSEFIAFIDGDDLVPPDYLETLLNAIQQTDMAIIGSKNLHPNGNTSTRLKVRTNHYSTSQNPLELIQRLSAGEWEYPNWNKLYRSEIIQKHKIAFRSELNIGEDSLFTLEYLLHATSVSASNTTSYIYRTRIDSAYRSAGPLQLWTEHCKKCTLIEEILDSNESCKKFPLTQLLINEPTIFTALPALRKTIKGSDKSRTKLLTQTLKQAKPQWFNPNGLSISKGAYTLLFLYSRGINWPSTTVWANSKLLS